jgi:soluble lytic murein transglycosylase-like protein
MKTPFLTPIRFWQMLLAAAMACVYANAWASVAPAKLPLKVAKVAPVEKPLPIKERPAAWQTKVAQSTYTEQAYEYLAYFTPQRVAQLKQIQVFERDQVSISHEALHAAIPANYQESMRPYLPLIASLAQEYEVSPLWVLAIIWTESHFNPLAHSRVKAMGLMQVMPDTARDIFKKLHVEVDHAQVEMLLANPLANLEAGIYHFAYLVRLFKHDYQLATVAYNMGHGWVLNRLKQGQPVGVKNVYLTKVKTAYARLEKNYIRNSMVKTDHHTAQRLSYVPNALNVAVKNQSAI